MRVTKTTTEIMILIFGRATYQSYPSGNALPQNFVVQGTFQQPASHLINDATTFGQVQLPQNPKKTKIMVWNNQKTFNKRELVWILNGVSIDVVKKHTDTHTTSIIPFRVHTNSPLLNVF